MNITLIIGYTAVSTSILLITLYVLKIFVTKKPKVRYDLINSYEIAIIRVGAFGLVIGTEFLFVIPPGFELIPETISRFFLALGSASIALVAIHYFLKVYYPKVVERRLKILRYTPRISPKTGEAMILLHESEEDTYLDDSMIADENIHSVDYDVWVDKKTGYTEIEKYLGYKHALECSECGYQTLLTLKEVVDIPPTAQKPGLLVKHFKCKYCNYRTYKELVLKKSKSLESVFMNS